MHDFWKEVAGNEILWITVISWSVAQCIKIIIGITQEKRFNFKWIVSTGGMPSAHAAGVSALATTIGLNIGFDTPYFALAAIFAFITMFDAQTSRRSIGVQARVLNKIVEDLSQKGKIEEQRLRELIGHTPVEVFIGSILGIVIGVTLTGRL